MVGEIPQDEALQIIRTAVSLRDELKQQMQAVFGTIIWPRKDFIPAFRKRVTGSQSAEERKGYGHVFHKFMALRWWINRYFGKIEKVP